LTDTVLVTGATGFVGSSLCRALLRRGYTVRALHRKTSSLRALEGLPVALFTGDILSPSTLTEAVQGARWVFHAAAQSAYWRKPEAVVSASVDGTRNMLLSAQEAGVERVVFTSSLAAMGIPAGDRLLTEVDAFNLPPGKFQYGFSKYKAEQEAMRFVQGGLDVVVLNPAIVLGAGDINQIGGSMIVEADRGWGFFYTAGGTNYVHIDDVVSGHLAALDHGRTGERYILGGENLTHYDAIATINEVVGRKPPWLKVPVPMTEAGAYLVDWARPFLRLPFDSNHLRMSRYNIFCDNRKSRTELNLPSPKPFRTAVEETYEWYKDEGIL
jgi:dihydroflavonol-4-reductase